MAPRPPSILACPVCGEPLARGDGAFLCLQGHSFDVARSGYVNLLLANQRASKDPGDDKAMMAARTAFLDAGHYAPVADALADAVLASEPSVVLDIGCGEGHYLRRLRERFALEETPAPFLCGMDISRHAATAAAKRDDLGLYVIGSAYRMPFLAASADLVMAHFSPISADEIARVTRPGGHVVIGGPGPRHLFGLKALIYDHPAEHPEADPLAGQDAFALITERRVRYDLRLQGGHAVDDLLRMTPYFWSAPPEKQARLSALEVLDTEVDVIVRTYRRRSDEAQTLPSASPPP